MPLDLAEASLLLTFFNALTEGSTYALIAVGYTMVYGIVKLINFAHGEVYMVGAVTAWWLFVTPQVPLLAALLLAMAVCAALGLALDRVAYRPLRRSTRLAALITAIGMSLVLQTTVQLTFGAKFEAFPETTRARVLVDGCPARERPDPAAREVVTLGLGSQPPVARHAGPSPAGWVPVAWTVDPRAPGPDGPSPEGPPGEGADDASTSAVLWVEAAHVRRLQGTPPALNADVLAGAGGERLKLPLKDVLIWVAAAGMMLGLHLLVQRTKVGRAMRACALDQTTAALMGVSVDRVIAYTFMIGSAMAAVAGVLYSLKVGGNISFRMGYYPGVIAFAAAVLGGIGNLKGALLGGMLLGFTKAFCATYLSSDYDFAACFSVMIGVIIFRPYGLLGRPGATRA